MVVVGADAGSPSASSPAPTGDGHDQADDERRRHHGQDDPEGEHGVAA